MPRPVADCTVRDATSRRPIGRTDGRTDASNSVVRAGAARRGDKSLESEPEPPIGTGAAEQAVTIMTSRGWTRRRRDVEEQQRQQRQQQKRMAAIVTEKTTTTTRRDVGTHYLSKRSSARPLAHSLVRLEPMTAQIRSFFGLVGTFLSRVKSVRKRCRYRYRSFSFC